MNRLSIFIGLFEEEEENSDVVFHFLFCSFVYDCTFRKKRIGWITLSKSHSYRCAHALILSLSLPPFFLCLCKQAQTNNGCPYSYSHICILYDLCLGQYRFIACFIFISENLQFYANVFTRFAHSFFFLWFVVIIVLHLAENEHNFRVKEIRKAGKQNTFWIATHAQHTNKQTTEKK